MSYFLLGPRGTGKSTLADLRHPKSLIDRKTISNFIYNALALHIRRKDDVEAIQN